MGAEFSSQMNRGIDDLYTGTPRDTLRRYELVVQTIETLQVQNSVYISKRYETWHRYVVLRNMLRRKIEKLYANKQLEDMGKNFDVSMLAGINFGESNDTFPRHTISLGRIQWLPGEFSEMINVYVEEYSPTQPNNRVTIKYRISRFAPAQELWNMVRDSRMERGQSIYVHYQGTNFEVLVLFSIEIPRVFTTTQYKKVIFNFSQEPLTKVGVDDEEKLRMMVGL